MSDTELKNPIPFQINKWSLGIRPEAAGETGWHIAPDGGPFVQGGPQLHLDICKPRNAADTGAFVGHCWSIGGGSLFDTKGNRSDRISGSLHLFFDDNRIAVTFPLLRVVHRDLESGEDYWGGGGGIGFIHRLLPPYRPSNSGGKHRVIPFWGAKAALDIYGGNGAVGVDLSLQLTAGVEFGFFQF